MKSARNCFAMLAALLALSTASAVLAGFPDNWTKDPANPISTDFWGTTVIFHEGIYKAWGEAVDGIDYATSPDGRTWTIHPASPVLVPGPDPESWYDVDATDVPSIVLVDGVYHMFYSCIAADGNNRIAHATSSDGIAWTKDPANPVLDLGPPGSIDESEVMHPCVIYEAPLFRLWYNAHEDAPGDTPQRIAYATSYDGVTWARYPSPVLEPGAPGDWDDDALFMMNVVHYQATYYMFYTGGTKDGLGNLGPLQIGYATSPDGVGWTKRVPSEPVLGVGDTGAWDSLLVGGPVVMETDTGFLMWYAGGPDFENIAWGIATALLPEDDCNNNGLEDQAELAGDPSIDWNDDGIIDNCQQGQGISGVPPGSGQRARLLDAYPNPFNPQTTIVLDLPKRVAMSLRVFDMTGRLVRALVDSGIRGPGRTEVVWNGRDNSGRQVASGTYFYRFSAGDYNETKRIVLIK